MSLALCVGLVAEAFTKWTRAWAKPAVTVYGTVIFWYFGDYILSEPEDYAVYDPHVVVIAFLQIALFLAAFRVFLPSLAKRMGRDAQHARLNMARRGTLRPTGEFSPVFMNRTLVIAIAGWVGIFVCGIYHNTDFWPALLWPPLHHEKLGMYPLTGVGRGNSFLFAALGYLHILVCSMLGVLAIIARGPTRWVAWAMICVTWPYFWFDRTRSKMLALLLPGFAAFWLIDRRGIVVKSAVSALLFLFVQLWFSQVMSYRGNENLQDMASFESSKPVKHLGQDMMKELCWINTFIADGSYLPNWGERYLAEIVAPIPRALWPEKPLIGIDYAIARGFGGSDIGHGVFATVSTGMIGQGCVNFGRFPGAIVAGFLFATWAAFLSRLWHQRASPLRLALFLVGLGLTFNTGRDLTLLVLFPFLFGYMATRLYERMRPQLAGRETPRTIPPSKMPRRHPLA
ncbi:hypothetical protein OKA04_21455 [Luteolibacter flavescens]|uniref:Oligosaccharide repeat unit polymerase n=1 Tax=Luteolibacter flavescens TaxID=1859460 RepID=A0ABT3FUQ2_9BACT|nr:hypothetical protein [Luteolibacter flavescens]MCW1887319.1 hypothetical protein [Luteolibacter flavescens]